MFGLRHVGSGLRYGNVYQVMTPLKIDKPVNGEFNDVVWENCVKLGALKKDYSAAGLCDDGLHCMELGFESTP